MPARRGLAPQHRPVAAAVAALVALLVLAATVRLTDGVPTTAVTLTAARSAPTTPAAAAPARPARSRPVIRHVFGDGRFLVAYYGTGGTGALGVLGETSPEVMHHRLERAAAAFRRPGHPVQLVYELIVTIADRSPGRDGDYSHDVDARTVNRYVEAARRHHALLLLDLQPGRSRFLDVARRFTWALRQPHVGLALDPEWRMGRTQVPGHVVGSTSAKEVNLVSGWLTRLRAQHHLPEKLFVVHQFRTSMVRDIDQVVRRPGLAMVQHVDGFGTPGQKLATFHAVAHPGPFTMGFKLFYDEDVHRMTPQQVFRIKPWVRFVSFQ